jgi:hypothetical protein
MGDSNEHSSLPQPVQKPGQLIVTLTKSATLLSAQITKQIVATMVNNM